MFRKSSDLAPHARGIRSRRPFGEDATPAPRVGRAAIKVLVALAVPAIASLSITAETRAQGTGQTVLSGEDAYVSQVVVDATGTMTYLTISGSRSTLSQPGMPASTSVACQVDILQIAADGMPLLQGSGTAAEGATTFTINRNLSAAGLKASLTVFDSFSGAEVAVDVALSFRSHGPITRTVTDNGNPGELLVKDSRDAVANGSIRIGEQRLRLKALPAELERSTITVP